MPNETPTSLEWPEDKPCLEEYRIILQRLREEYPAESPRIRHLVAYFEGILTPESAQPDSAAPADPVSSPPHYTSGPCCEHCGQPIECIVVTERMGFRLGNVVKYLWRAGKKGPPLEDLRKARWYLDREISSNSPDRKGPRK